MAATSRRPMRPWLRALILLWHVSPGHVAGVLTVTVLTSILPALTVVLTTVAVQAVADSTAPGRGPEVLRLALLAAGGLAGLAAVGHLLSVVRGYLETLLQYRMANDVQQQIMEKSVRLQLRDFEDAETYDKLQRANREAAYRPYQVLANLTSVASNFVALASVGVVLFSWDVRVALAVMLAPVPSMVANLFYSRMGWRIENDRAPDRRRTSYLQYLVTTDRTFKETRLFDLGPLFVQRFRELVTRFYSIDRRLEGRQAVATGLLGMLSVVALGGAILLAVQATVANGQVGQFAGYVAAVGLVHSSVQALFGGLAQLYEHNLFLANLFGFLELPERRAPAGPTRPLPAVLTKGVEFRNVSFTYPGTATTVLASLNLFLPAGRCVALVGPNGAGKTTLVKLLARFYEATEGSILIDDVPIEEYDLDGLRQHIGVIFQDFVQYEASARENVGYGRHSELENEAKILAAAEQAGVLPLLQRLPRGLDTQLGRWFEEGHQLSGGQWQKVALARAFLRNAPIVVLDEPTASVDAASEAEVFGRLREIAGRATTVLIAHRFSTVRVADHIIVMDRGQILEQGSHPELMAAEGMYAHLFRLQAAGYLDEPAESSPTESVPG
ncbi:MAG: ABC transporter ATP-binding protein/permease [Actinomycetota bacterium]|nr:ABC transporter ATP-binding protein/permease [Actinomycetota bacterium]